MDGSDDTLGEIMVPGEEPDGNTHLLRSMAEASPLAMAVCEGASHLLRYVNPSFCRLYGRTAAELLGRPFAEACPDDQPAVAKSLLDRVFASGAAESLADLTRERPETGAAFWSFAAWPLLNQQGVGTQVTITTDRYRAFEERQGELRRANQQLLLAALREDERSERLQYADRAKDEFVAMLAHELRNPLAAIRNGIYLLDQRAGPTDTDTHATCALLEHQMRNLSHMLDDLLDVSRLTRGRIELHLETVDVKDVVRQAVAASRSLLDLQQHQLTLSLPENPVWVAADPVRLEQVVTNLLQNAIKYMDAGGQVWLSLETLPGEAEPGVPPEAGTALIRVRDTGIGIRPEALLHIFELFDQADRTHKRGMGGLGIGLTLVRRLVELHHGSVEAQSAGLGQGSEFRVLLPLGGPPPQAPNLEPVPERALAASGRLRVLLVEDNAAAAITLSEILDLWGHEVLIVHSGIKALATAADARPDVALVDIGLPGLDGYEVARRLRVLPALRDTLLVALTGYGQDADRQRSREAGFDHHLVKPVDLDKLRRLIDIHAGANARQRVNP